MAAVAALLLVVGSLAAACGRADVTNVSGEGCGGPGVNGQEIRAGLIFTDTGPVAGNFRDFRGGVDARFGEANAAGGVHGRRLVYDWVDDADDADENRHAAKTLVDQSGVFGILESSTVATGSAAVLHLQGVPVAGVANEPAWGLYNNMFTYSYLPGKDSGVDIWGRYARQQGGRRAMVPYLGQDDRSSTLAQIFVRSLQAAGIEVVSQVEVEPGFTNLTRLAAQFNAEHDDVLIGSVTDDDFAGLIRAIQADGGRLRAAISPNGYEPASAGGSRWPAGASVFLYYRPFESGGPAHERYLAALAKYSPQTDEGRRAMAMDGWVAADIFIRGLQEAGPCPTRAAFIQKLRAVKGYDADGLLVKPIDFARDFGRTNTCVAFVQLDPSGRRWNPVEPTPLCGEYLSTP